MHWRTFLNEYRMRHGNNLVTKDKFLRLLKKLTEAIGMQKSQPLMNGFKKCGLKPVNKDEVLKRISFYYSEISATEQSVSSTISETVLQFLSKERYSGNDSMNTTRQRKLSVSGKGIPKDDVLPLLQRREGKRKLNKDDQLASDKENHPPML
ncbi:hypothetical protein QAD02_016277 [Eretmocerus hayati]|uniref:Uncharacterized protein n=1 Tax=Eretmocerus hayati TaxID=131215 RepID=A0ACC2PFF2_9HYME|nr:hypothetical protein QAD02_016277 [Eretmocerus hayati]